MEYHVFDELLKDNTFKWGLSVLGTMLAFMASLAGYIWKRTLSEIHDKIQTANGERHEDAVALRKEMSKMNSNFLKFSEQISDIKQDVAVQAEKVKKNTADIEEIKQKLS